MILELQQGKRSTRKPQARAHRTTPQRREASRRNGSKSRGPRTPEGKSRSRTNALKHGILSRVLPPQNTARTDRRSFDQMLSQIVADYQPHTQLELIHLESLAVNIFRLERVLAMQDLQLDPDQISTPEPNMESVRCDLNDVRRREELIHQLARDLDAGRPLSLSDSDCKLVADSLWLDMEIWAEEVADAMEPLAEAEAQNPPDAAGGASLGEGSGADEHDARIFDGKAMGVTDRNDLESVLSGRKRIAEKHREAWRTCLTELVKESPENIAGAEARNKEASRMEKRRLKETSMYLASLETLMKYESHIRRCIERDHLALERLAQMNWGDPVSQVRS